MLAISGSVDAASTGPALDDLWMVLRTLAAEGLTEAGRVEGIEPEGPLGQWLEAQAEALRALAEILGGQELRFEELMHNVSAAARAELEKLAAATELGNNVVRAGEVALRQARTAQISLQVEKEDLTAMMVKETLPLFVERLKEALIIRERRWNDDVKRRRLATAGISGIPKECRARHPT